MFPKVGDGELSASVDMDRRISTELRRLNGDSIVTVIIN